MLTQTGMQWGGMMGGFWRGAFVADASLLFCVAAARALLACCRYFFPLPPVRFLRDTLKTKEKCVKATAEALASGHSVVVDNTNPSGEVRSLYIQLARKQSPPVPVRCFHFVATEEVAKHLNMYREKLTQGAHKHVPRIAYNMFKKNWQKPEIKEGFKEIKMIDFQPYFDATPAGEEAKRLFYQMS